MAFSLVSTYKLLSAVVTEVASSVQARNTAREGTFVVSTAADSLIVNLEGRPDENSGWILLGQIGTGNLEDSPVSGATRRVAVGRTKLLPEYRVRVQYLAGDDRTTDVYVVPDHSDVLTELPLSGTDTTGVSQVEVTATVIGSANVVHTAPAGSDIADFVTLYAVNLDGASNYNLTLAVGTELIGPLQINRLQVPVLVLSNYRMNNALELLAYASAASKVRLFGTVQARYVRATV